MALNAYLRMSGEAQGEIKGSVTQAGREDSILVIAFSHGMEDTGLDPKKPLFAHSPLTITKEIDRATPLLTFVFGFNEVLTDWELTFWRPTATGQEVQYYTIELIEARITAIRQEMLNNQYPENAPHAVREHVSFTYESIRQTWEDGGLTAELEWPT